MPRHARLILENAVYHVTARGNRKQQLFFGADDYGFYLKTLWTKSEALGLELLGWCLMPNHVHLLVRELRTQAMSQTIRSVHSAYALRLNQQLGEGSGHAWQGRYYSVPVPRRCLWTVLRYIELNPVRAGLVHQAEKFRWSTGQHHVRPASKPVSLSLADWLECWNAAQWAEVLASGVGEEEERQIRRATKLGRWQEPAVLAAAAAPIPH